MKTIAQALRIMVAHTWTIVLFMVLSVATIYLFYWVFSLQTSWLVAWYNNAHWYFIAQVALSLANSLSIALALTMFIYLFRQRDLHNLTIMQVVGSLGLSILSTGCYVCGSIVLPTIGLAASLTALPFGGLEIKVITLLLTLYAVYEYSEKVTGICHMHPRRPIHIKDKKVTVSRKWYDWQTFVVMSALITALVLVPLMPRQIGKTFGTFVVPQSTQPNPYQCSRH